VARAGIKVEQQARIQVFYSERLVGSYNADLLVADAVIVELKVVRTLAKEHDAQLLNYLKATPYEVGLLLNFGPGAQVRRKVFDNEIKGDLSWTRGQDNRGHG
jgi:GxxExxY protein